MMLESATSLTVNLGSSVGLPDSRHCEIRGWIRLNLFKPTEIKSIFLFIIFFYPSAFKWNSGSNETH